MAAAVMDLPQPHPFQPTATLLPADKVGESTLRELPFELTFWLIPLLFSPRMRPNTVLVRRVYCPASTP